MSKRVGKLFEIIKRELKTEVGKINVFFGILLLIVFGYLEVKSWVLQSVLKFLSEKEIPNTTGKFVVSMIIFFFASLCVVAFIESKSQPHD